MIKNVVFDIGNVLVKFGWVDFFKGFDLTLAKFYNALKSPTIWAFTYPFATLISTSFTFK